MSFVYESYGILFYVVRNSRVSGCCQIELGSTYLLCRRKWRKQGMLPSNNRKSISILEGALNFHMGFTRSRDTFYSSSVGQNSIMSIGFLSRVDFTNTGILGTCGKKGYSPLVRRSDNPRVR